MVGVYSLKQLRSVAIGEAALQDFDGQPDTEVLSEEAIRACFILDEAYYGRDQLKEVEVVMCKIERKIAANPLVDVCREPEGKELDEALKKAFGFKSVHVYWMRDPNMDKTGPCTVPAARVMNYKNQNLKYGSFKNGFYDKDHNMVVFIQMDNALVTEAHLTGAEMTAVVVHEIGHNFDFTPFALIKTWIDAINVILDGITTGKINKAAMTLLKSAVVRSDVGRRIYMEIMNLSDTIGKIIPPLGTVMYYLQLVKGSVEKVLNMILTPVAAVMFLPRALMFMSLNYIRNFFLRKSETYADSLAAAYGYGPEQVSALDKMSFGILTLNNAPRGIFTIFDNMVMAHQEIMTLARGGHGSTQQRALRMIDSLKREIENPALDAATKKECRAELARLEDMYDKITNMNEDDRMILTNIVRGIMDQWYAGTSPNLLPILWPEYTYAN